MVYIYLHTCIMCVWLVWRRRGAAAAIRALDAAKSSRIISVRAYVRMIRTCVHTYVRTHVPTCITYVHTHIRTCITYVRVMHVRAYVKKFSTHIQKSSMQPPLDALVCVCVCVRARARVCVMLGSTRLRK